MPRLKENIYSSVSRTCYGTAGMVVKIVATHGDVEIVEDQDGNRFPVSSSKLEYDQQAAIKPDTRPPPDKKGKSTPGRKNSKQAQQIQTLF